MTDGTSAGERTYWTDAELWAAAELDAHRRGVRFYSNQANNRITAYHHLRKRHAAGGDGTTSTTQYIIDAYDVGHDLAAVKRKRGSAQRQLHDLARWGAIELNEHRSPNGAGKSLGLRYRLLPVPREVARLAASRGCSSVG
ncbi:MAG TPA: hypothetical protein VGN69_04270 [Solirubrobacteraceae bacterium]|nr:hypothetical protein [Solirubrobacteraceae bacterium]